MKELALYSQNLYQLTISTAHFDMAKYYICVFFIAVKLPPRPVRFNLHNPFCRHMDLSEGQN